jgi:hypothetical protein
MTFLDPPYPTFGTPTAVARPRSGEIQSGSVRIFALLHYLIHNNVISVSLPVVVRHKMARLFRYCRRCQVPVLHVGWLITRTQLYHSWNPTAKQIRKVPLMIGLLFERTGSRAMSISQMEGYFFSLI